MLRTWIVRGVWVVIALGVLSFFKPEAFTTILFLMAWFMVCFAVSYADRPDPRRAGAMAGWGLVLAVWLIPLAFNIIFGVFSELLTRFGILSVGTVESITQNLTMQHGVTFAGVVVTLLPFLMSLAVLVEQAGEFYDRWIPSLEKRAGLVHEELWDDLGIPLGFAHPLPKRYVFFGPSKRTNVKPLYYAGDRHLITFGPTGSGKNTTVQTPALLSINNREASALVIDVKGQLCAITTEQRVHLGHKVAALNPFEMFGIPSASYNPLAHLSPQSVNFVSDCTRIAEGLVEQKKADHWEISALSYVQLLIMWVVLYDPDKSLVRVWELVNLDDASRIAHCTLMAACPEQTIAVSARRFMSASNEVRDCISTAMAQTDFLKDPAVQKILKGGSNELSFAELKRRRMTIFLMIPFGKLGTQGKFLRLMVMSAAMELENTSSQPKKPVLFMLDEFLQLGYLSIIKTGANIFRDFKIRLWVIVQNLPDLQKLYDDNWEGFLSAAGITQIFTPNDMTTAKYFSERSGVKRLKRFSISRGSGGRSTTTTDTENPLYTVENLFDMASEEQLLICPGFSKAIQATRAPYYELSWYECAEQDPYRMTTAEVAAFTEKARKGQWHIGLDGISYPKASRYGNFFGGPSTI